MATQEQRTKIVWDYAPAPESPEHVRLRDSLRALHRGRVPRPDRRHARAVDQPGHRGASGRGGIRGAGRRSPRGRGGPRRSARLGRSQRTRARQVPVSRCAADPGTGEGARHRRIHGRRQADPRVARRGRAARRGALLPLRGLGRQALLRDGRPRRRAARRGRADRALELPAADGGLEAGAGARVREHVGAEAGRDHSGHRAAARRDLPGGGASARSRLDHSGRRRGRSHARSRARHRQGRIHRINRCRQGHPGGARRARHLADAGAGRASRRTSCSRTPRSTRRSRGS